MFTRSSPIKNILELTKEENVFRDELTNLDILELTIEENVYFGYSEGAC
jgi:hypothetical protein